LAKKSTFAPLRPPYAHRTQRLEQSQAELGFAVGAEAGSVVLNILHMVTSPDSVLRSMKKMPMKSAPTPRVLGVDDFALRKGIRYGTLLVDLEKHQVVDLLPDRQASTVQNWLEAHPGVEVVSRDRASDFSRAATQGAPKAIQIADRWHLLANLSEVVYQWMLAQQSQLKPFLTELQPQWRARLEPKPPPTPPSESLPRTKTSLWKRVLGLRHVKPRSEKRSPLAPPIDVKPRAKKDWWSAHSLPSLSFEQRSHLEALWHRTSGQIALPDLERELRLLGFLGTRTELRQYLYHLDLEHQRQIRDEVPQAAQPPTLAGRPNLRALAWLMTRTPQNLDALESKFLEQLCSQYPPLQTGYDLIGRFRGLITERHPENAQRFVEWIEDTLTARIPHLSRFAKSLEGDLYAVQAAMTLPWSNGQTEGQVCRLKLIKRRHYGRASFDLLRRCVAHHP